MIIEQLKVSTKKILKKIWQIPKKAIRIKDRPHQRKQAIAASKNIIRNYAYIDKPLVLITQIQRSGGSLLTQLFDGHPECYVHPSEIAWGKPSKYNWPDLNIRRTERKIYYDLYERYIDSYCIKGYSKYGKGTPREKQEFLPFCFNRRGQELLFIEFMNSHKPQNQREVLNNYMTSFFNAWLDYQGLYDINKKFLVGFTPRVNMYSKNSKLFFKDYPDGYMITIVRNPINWFASAKKHSKKYSDVENAINLWKQSCISSIELNEKYGDRVILLLFENLINDQVKTMHNICNHIGINYNDILLNPTFNTLPIAADSSFISNKKGIIKDVVNRKTFLTDAERAYIESEAMKMYYELQIDLTKTVMK